MTRAQQIQLYKRDLTLLNQQLRMGKISQLQYEYEAEKLDRRYNSANYGRRVN